MVADWPDVHPIYGVFSTGYNRLCGVFSVLCGSFLCFEAYNEAIEVKTEDQMSSLSRGPLIKLH